MEMSSSAFVIRGGLDLTTAAYEMNSGRAIAGVNYEPEERGLRRVGGVEAYDGQPRPSQASYWVLAYDAGTAAISEGDLLTGATSGASGTVVQDATIDTGAIGTGDAAGFVILMNVTGTFQDDENLEVSSSTVAQADGEAQIRGALNDADDKTWLQAVIDKRRLLIGQVPGAGPVTGLGELAGTLYAIRDNVARTAGVLHKATSTGWVAQDLGHYIDFTGANNTGGPTGFVDGETVTGSTSSASGIIRRVVLSEGAWGGTGAGFLTISDITGTFSAGETITGGTSAVTATAAAGQQAYSIAPGGRYSTITNNFYGAKYSDRLYAAGGTGPAFEWDGEYFSLIKTGLEDALEKPIYIAEYAQHLFLLYAGGHIQHSEIGEPLRFQADGGAASYTLGSEPAGFIEGASSALIVLGTKRIKYFYGTSAADFQFRDVAKKSGAKPGTGQHATGPLFLDDGGVRTIEAAETFGNWRMGSITRHFKPFFEKKAKNNVVPVLSMKVTGRDYYRIFFSDKTMLTVYLGRKLKEGMPIEYPFQAHCVVSAELAGDAAETHYVGAEDGYVYELDRGRSFNGEKIFAFARLAFHDSNSPHRNKRWALVKVQCDAPANAEIFLTAEAAYGSPEYLAGGEQVFTVAGGGGLWNDSNWNQFYWSAQYVGEAQARIEAKGENLSISVISETADEDPHILTAMTLYHSERGMKG